MYTQTGFLCCLFTHFSATWPSCLTICPGQLYKPIVTEIFFFPNLFMQIEADICNKPNRDPIISGEFYSSITMFSLVRLPNHIRTQPVLTKEL